MFESYRDLIRKYGGKVTILTTLKEWFSPSEGEYSRPGPSGLGSWYFGPPITTRVQRRLEGYYDRGDEK